MADMDRRGRGGRGYNNRKRRYNDDDDFDRRPQRRRYEEPLAVKLQKQLLVVAESPLRRTEDEISGIAKTLADNYFDDDLQQGFYDLLMQLIVEQPLKIPFVAAIVLVANAQKPEITAEILNRAGAAAQKYLEAGSWRNVKLALRFLACLQSLFEGDGVLPVLEDLFSRAVELQTASSDDALGLELVKIILLTIPYVLASPATGLEQQASALLEKTDIIASTPSNLEALVDPYSDSAGYEGREDASVISLLQKQLQSEATNGWKLDCLPRPWKTISTDDEAEPLAAASKHTFPSLHVPDPPKQETQSLYPEWFFSVYAEQDIETVPSTNSLASSLIRDSLTDTINILDYNRNATAKFLIDVDCFFAPGTFVKRATPFDRLKEVEEGRSTWKPEDVAVDAVFSLLFQLPAPEHKLVYYHAVLTESCKIAPAAIAPSLGRAIRFLYRHVDAMDLELGYRFTDWFSHHLSNFGFTWKWTEWVDDVGLPTLHPKKAFIIGALEKEIRLSFAQRIRGTLPEPYQALVPEAKEKDTPDYKFNSEQTAFSSEGKQLLALLRKRAPDDEVQPVIDAIHAQAASYDISDPLVASTDVYVTALCFIGSKSLSHVLSAIERCKDRLLAIGPQSAVARKQIITSVMSYWTDQPGIGVNIIDKLLNYTILTPMSVIDWALIDSSQGGKALAESHVYEMVSTTVYKVTNRVRQIMAARDQQGLPRDQVAMLDATLTAERASQRELFTVIQDALSSFAEGNKDEMMELSGAQDGASEEAELIRGWGARWLRVFERKNAVEESIIVAETEELAAAALVDGDAGLQGNGDASGGAFGNGMREGNGVVEARAPQSSQPSSEGIM
ncbi:MAG: hypothetical protein M1817_006565 [Caeruleum heppii]|nr:MAG: hypothetical protein M1817_006565 [Caeruleum heppii]